VNHTKAGKLFIQYHALFPESGVPVDPTQETKGSARKEIPINVGVLKREAVSGHARPCASRTALFRWKGIGFESVDEDNRADEQ
jgi:hypothetical protein